jgi:sterol desaturase/sphingolipid hydroxylase (fatty acid hydroxylase superfamily)
VLTLSPVVPAEAAGPWHGQVLDAETRGLIELALPLVLAMGAALVALEHWFPAHPIRPDVRWYVRALAINAVQVLVYLGVAHAWSRWGARASLDLAGRRLPAVAGALLAYVIFTFVVYWWHRARHASPLLWRIVHQFHHSPTRIQTLTAYYIHPLDMLVVLTISHLILFPLLGLDLEAAAWYMVITGCAGFFIHANIRVPRAVGYVFQTPEMHRVHHKTGHHAHNYADLVWWDMLFGTYANPRDAIDTCGFDEHTERQIVPMLAGVDLSRPR